MDSEMPRARGLSTVLKTRHRGREAVTHESHDSRLGLMSARAGCAAAAKDSRPQDSLLNEHTFTVQATQRQPRRQLQLAVPSQVQVE